MNTSSVNNYAKHTFKPNGFQNFLANKIGKNIPEKISDFCDLTTKASMKRMTQFSILAVCVLLGRYIQARNDDERREILTRDVGMVVTAVYGVPFCKKIASMFVNQRTGIPIASGEKGIKQNLNPEKGMKMASYDQLAEWLSVKNTEAFNGMKNGFTGFCINIKKLGGNLMECFNILDKNSKEALNDLSKSLGRKEEVTNDNIIGLFRNAQRSKDKGIQQKLENLKKLFIHNVDKKQNIEIISPLLTKASHYKSAIEFSSIAAAAFILGGLLPWFNIQHTKKLYKDKNAEATGLNNNSPANKLTISSTAASNSNIMDKFKKFEQSGQIN